MTKFLVSMFRYVLNQNALREWYYLIKIIVNIQILVEFHQLLIKIIGRRWNCKTSLE